MSSSSTTRTYAEPTVVVPEPTSMQWTRPFGATSVARPGSSRGDCAAQVSSFSGRGPLRPFGHGGGNLLPEHHHLPARVVLHKTSSYTDDEIAGFRAAAGHADADMLEMLWLPADDPVRLFRSAAHPPLRGTLLSVNDQRHILYTRGSVPFYGTYPGMYIPSPLPFRLVETESSPEYLADEMLALTKMNWNQTQLDGRQPITIRTADRVGEILRHLGPNDRPQGRYAYYM